MKRTMIYSIIIILFTVFIYIFFHKKYVKCELLLNIPHSDEEFYPNAYEFFHSKEDMERYFHRNDRTRKYEKECEKIEFDFDKNTYVFVYGKKIKNMFYSYKTSFFNDTSPSYSKPKNKTLIFIDYEDNNDKGVFIYKLDKNPNLRGFYGI